MKKLASFFKAFSEEIRLRIFAMLAAAPEACVCALSKVLKTTQSKTSRHLAYMKKNGLVSSRRLGTWIYYRIERKTEEIKPALLKTIKFCLMKKRQVKKDLKKLAALSLKNGKAPDRLRQAKPYN
ncbi:MAG TPA: metalloregulator ArsR/SmtB family transcription factor [Candidatus Wallbacteria bacterium]|nr:metalloregulator ArsR/SmtB family transcription factor [Candidatus Wallbacteria bacterium]